VITLRINSKIESLRGFIRFTKILSIIKNGRKIATPNRTKTPPKLLPPFNVNAYKPKGIPIIKIMMPTIRNNVGLYFKL
jgi:hypothetical protein|tara:strand:+ start:653 stop:889 length:237 start_codon:yes stop_codon:yes gene_type:complete